MFDVDLSKLTVIIVVAMVVLGPERLPHVARTAGNLLGRAQRYFAGVRNDLAQQIELDEIRRLKDELLAAKGSIEKSALSASHALGQHGTLLKGQLNGALGEVKAALDETYLPSMHDRGAFAAPAPLPLVEGAIQHAPEHGLAAGAQRSWSDRVAQPSSLMPSTEFSRGSVPRPGRSSPRAPRPANGRTPQTLRRKHLGTSASRHARRGVPG